MKCQILLMMVVSSISCNSEDGDQLSEAFVEDELQPYFDNFKEEGLAREIDVDFILTQIEGHIDNTEGRNVAGQCFYNAISPNRIVISNRYWALSSELQKEMIVFHELGHCYLLRNHLDVSDEGASCLSIMHSSSTVCNLDYNSTSRSSYLDELFTQ